MEAEKKQYTPVVELPHSIMDGTQKIFKFANGYGASVVRGSFSYGGDKGKWELAVITHEKYDGLLEFKLTYDTPITDDVEGYLSDDSVNELLSKIEALPSRWG